VRRVQRHDDVIEVDVAEGDTEASDDVVSAVTDEFEHGERVRELVVRVIGTPRGMAVLMRKLVSEAHDRNVSVKWRL